MAEVLPFPRLGEMFVDARGNDRMMRVSLHPERGVAVVSLWAGSACRATFQLPLAEAARLAETLGSVPDAAAVDDPSAGVVTTSEMLACGLPPAS